MDPLADPALDRDEFEHRIKVHLKRCKAQCIPDLTYAMATGDLSTQTKHRKRIQAYEAWVRDLLNKWDAADEDGRRQLVGSIVVDDESIKKNFSPAL